MAVGNGLKALQHPPAFGRRALSLVLPRVRGRRVLRLKQRYVPRFADGRLQSTNVILLRIDMRKFLLLGFSALCFLNVAAAQTPARADNAAAQPFAAGKPLATPSNAKTYGGFRFAESVSYDADRDLYIVPSAGMPQKLVPNDGYVSLVNPDGTVHTLKWIGVDRNGLTLNHPLGSDIANGLLYLADIDHVRWFDLKTGEPRGSVHIPGAKFLNDLEVASDGTIYVSDTGDVTAADANPDSWRIYRITGGKTVSRFVVGAPLSRPNGVAFDQRGNIVVVNLGSRDVLTFSTAGKLIATEKSVDAGNDGIIVLKDGTKYVSSVRAGTVSRIRPGQPAELIASGIPSAASMGYDPKRHRLVIPMNDWNAITLLDLSAAK